MIERHSFNPALAESLYDNLLNESLFDVMASSGVEMNEYRNRLRHLAPYKEENILLGIKP